MIFVLSEQKLSNNKTRIMNVIEEQNQKGLLGYSDWRLPTIAEASKIVKNHLNFIKSSPLYTEEFITAEKGFFCIDSVGYICSAYFTSPTEKTTTSTGAQRVRFFPEETRRIYFSEFDMPHRNQARKILVVRGGKD